MCSSGGSIFCILCIQLRFVVPSLVCHILCTGILVCILCVFVSPHFGYYNKPISREIHKIEIVRKTVHNEIPHMDRSEMRRALSKTHLRIESKHRKHQLEAFSNLKYKGKTPTKGNNPILASEINVDTNVE